MANLQLMKTTITRALNTTVLLAKKHSPEILVIGGVIGTVASAVMACKATTKLDEILEDTKLRVDLIHDIRENPDNYENGHEYTEEDAKQSLTKTYVSTGVKVAQTYAPAVILGALSITSILTGHNILKRRNLALAAAYTAVDKGFKEYRGRVIERFGEEIDKQLTYNLKPEEVEETVIDEKTGKEKKVKKTVYKGDGTSTDPYSFLFDVGNPCWTKNADRNYFFLKAEQDWFNNTLVAKGHVFLNDVLDRLGFDKVSYGQLIGWIYDPNNPELQNYISFGFNNMEDEGTRAFATGAERSVWLRFNVDGDIYSYMKSPKYSGLFAQ